MLAKSWLFGLISAAALAAGTAWAVTGPDSLWQNHVVDPKRAAEITDAHLYHWNEQLSDDKAIVIFIHGWYPDGEPSREGASKVFMPAIVEFSNCANQREDRPFAYCLFTYDPSLDPREAAERLHALIEGDKLLTQAKSRFILSSHSFGGWVAQCYIAKFGRRKVLGRPSNGTPWHGVVWADRQQLREALLEIYPHLADTIMVQIDKRVDFESGSLKWMRPGNPERQRMLAAGALDSTCFLYVGKTSEMSTRSLARYTTPLLLFDAWGWGTDSITSHLAYQFGAAVVKASGDKSGSDGVASDASASAGGFNQLATVRRMGQYNHSQIIQGASDTLLHWQMYADMLSLLPVEEEEGLPILEPPDRCPLEGVDWSRCPKGRVDDSDSDGVPNYLEEMLGTDPHNIASYPLLCTDPTNPDTDGDGMSDSAELKEGTNPCDYESGGIARPPDLPSDWRPPPRASEGPPRETTGIEERWGDRTSEERDELVRQIAELDIPSNVVPEDEMPQIPREVRFPPFEDYDDDGLINGVEMDWWIKLHGYYFAKPCNALVNLVARCSLKPLLDICLGGVFTYFE